jgi:pimeloyl-ACP methyl ester carboxylesterase
MAAMAIFVLVPGAFAGSWIWREVIKPLWAAGHEVYTPSLTGMGERAHLAHPEINLSTHIQDVVAEVTCSGLKEVILVGYSYGGIVVTGVAEQIPERISKLVYLDALIPEDGQSYVDMFDPVFAETALQVVQTIGEGWKFYANLPDPRFTTQPYKTGLEKLSVKNPVAARLPRVFIYCTEGKTGEDLGLIPVTRAAERARSDPNWGYYEIPADHGVVFEHPDWVTEVLLKLA